MGKQNTKADYIKAIEKSKGSYAQVARILGIGRSAAHQYINKYPDLKELMAEQYEVRGDKLEDELLRQALGGNITALIFMLKTQYRSRGYSERVEQDHSGSIAVDVRYGERPNY